MVLGRWNCGVMGLRDSPYYGVPDAAIINFIIVEEAVGDSKQIIIWKG